MRAWALLVPFLLSGGLLLFLANLFIHSFNLFFPYSIYLFGCAGSLAATCMRDLVP